MFTDSFYFVFYLKEYEREGQSMKEKKKRYYKLGGILLLGIAAAGIKIILNHNEPPVIYQSGTSIQESGTGGESSGISTGSDQNTDPNQISEISESKTHQFPVYISGAVHTPGVYEITGSSYLYETLQEAGDLTEQAAKEYIHLVYQINHPLSVYIPTYEEINQYLSGNESTIMLLENSILQGILQIGDYSNHTNINSGAVGAATGENPVNSTFPVNINQADLQSLLTLPGIGNTIAEAIIKYRESNGPFSKIEDIMSVPGIKEGKFSAIQEMITV